jgi:hypothetical protein
MDVFKCLLAAIGTCATVSAKDADSILRFGGIECVSFYVRSLNNAVKVLGGPKFRMNFLVVEAH